MCRCSASPAGSSWPQSGQACMPGDCACCCCCGWCCCCCCCGGGAGAGDLLLPPDICCLRCSCAAGGWLVGRSRRGNGGWAWLAAAASVPPPLPPRTIWELSAASSPLFPARDWQAGLDGRGCWEGGSSAAPCAPERPTYRFSVRCIADRGRAICPGARCAGTPQGVAQQRTWQVRLMTAPRHLLRIPICLQSFGRHLRVALLARGRPLLRRSSAALKRAVRSLPAASICFVSACKPVGVLLLPKAAPHGRLCCEPARLVLQRQ